MIRVKCLGGCNCEFDINTVAELTHPQTNAEHVKYYGHQIVTEEVLKGYEKILEIARGKK